MSDDIVSTWEQVEKNAAAAETKKKAKPASLLLFIFGILTSFAFASAITFLVALIALGVGVNSQELSTSIYCVFFFFYGIFVRETFYASFNE